MNAETKPVKTDRELNVELMMEKSAINSQLMVAHVELQRQRQALKVIDLILADEKLAAIAELRRPLRLDVEVTCVMSTPAPATGKVDHGTWSAERKGRNLVMTHTPKPGPGKPKGGR